MELTEKQKTAFFKNFGQKVSVAIYEKFETKSKFLQETGFGKRALHRVITGNNTKLATIQKLAHALGVKVRDLMPDE